MGTFVNDSHTAKGHSARMFGGKDDCDVCDLQAFFLDSDVKDDIDYLSLRYSPVLEVFDACNVRFNLVDRCPDVLVVSVVRNVLDY
jgi:hypothetical protein